MSTEQPIVSILCAAYNHEAFIGKAIEGFLMQQTNFPFEIIVHDDASTDSTRKIVEQYESQYPTLFKNIYQTENQYFKEGAVAIMIKAARGKYIAFCEGDDYWIDPHKLQKQVDLLEKYPESSMSVALIKTLTNGNEVTESAFVNDTLPLIYQKGLIKYFHTSTYVMKKSYLDYVMKKYPPLFINDTAICFLMINIGPFVLLNDVVSVYRINDSGTWSGANRLKQDYLHYQLHRAFRKHHVLHRYFFHLKWEKKFLDKIIKENEEYSKKFRFRKLYVDAVFYTIKAFNKLIFILKS